MIPELAELVALRGACRGLTLHAKRPAIARLPGGHRSAQRGQGLEFEEVRPYTPGDDVRHIDWRVTARRGKPHTKCFRQERQRSVWIVADLHAGLFFGSKKQYKSSALLKAAAILGWVAVGGGDRLGAVISQAEKPSIILRPKARNAGVLALLNALISAQPRRPQTPDVHSLRRSLALLHPIVQPNSLILLLSDFAHLNSEVKTLIAMLSSHADVRCIAFGDPLEQQGISSGIFRLGLPDKIATLTGRGSQKRWQALWQAQRQSLRSLTEQHNIPMTELLTTDTIVEVVPALLREPDASSIL